MTIADGQAFSVDLVGNTGTIFWAKFSSNYLRIIHKKSVHALPGQEGVIELGLLLVVGVSGALSSM